MNRATLGVLLLASLAAPAFSESGIKSVQSVSTTQTVPFQAGGTIHLNHSYGELSIEGWDRAEVEITVTKTPYAVYDAKDEAESAKRMENVKVSVERKSDSDLEVSTAVTNFSRWRHPFGPEGGVSMEYRIRVPRQSKLAIRHENGMVLVSGVVGDIDATGHAGDIVVLLPETEKYAIDAVSKFGTVSSDFDGTFHHGIWSNRYTETTAAQAHRIRLHMGWGGIEIKGSPAQAQPPVTAGMH